MKFASLLWNLSRAALILFCGYQLILSSMDLQQAQRMLSENVPGEYHRAMPISTDHFEAVLQVLVRRNPLPYVLSLIFLALIPYTGTRDI